MIPFVEEIAAPLGPLTPSWSVAGVPHARRPIIGPCVVSFLCFVSLIVSFARVVVGANLLLEVVVVLAKGLNSPTAIVGLASKTESAALGAFFVG